MPQSRWLDKPPEEPSDAVPAPAAPELPEPPGSSPRRFPKIKLPWILAFVSAVLVGALISAAVVELPYFALRPGAVHDSSVAISVEGEPTYEADGTINYTTVSIQPVTTLDLITGWLDDDVDIKPRREILGDRDAETNRELNQILMDSSQQDATLVALETLGYDVEVDVKGELVEEVQPDAPADGVLERGDLIVELDGEPIDDPEALRQAMADKEPGEEVTVTVAPSAGEGEPEEHTLTLAEGPEDGPPAIMGVSVRRLDVPHFPIDVVFDIGDVGGPSAGLAFSLSIIDMLTGGDLTGGMDVAVTGAIGPDGKVQPVGGVGQKAAAVRQAEMDLFLMPAMEQDADKARDRAGDVEVVEVATIEDALEALADHGGDPLERPEELDEAA